MPRLVNTPITPESEPEICARLERARVVGDKAPTPLGGGVGATPCYTVIDCEQRSPEWFAARGGKITASAAGKWLISKPGKVRDRALHKACCDALATALPEDVEPFDTKVMARGRELEPQAIRAYEDATGNVCEAVGFCVHESGAFGCSPDSLVNDRAGGLEVKCPLRETIIRYLLADEPCPADEYGPQVHTSMAVTGLPWWDFWAWHPHLPPLIYRVERDETTDAYLAALVEAGAHLERMRQAIADLWDANGKDHTS